MAAIDIRALESAAMSRQDSNAEVFFELGMKYSTGNEIPTDRIAAHKWFNLAAMKGNGDAVRLRRELAEEMSDLEVAEAQRAAREWLQSL